MSDAIPNGILLCFGCGTVLVLLVTLCIRELLAERGAGTKPYREGWRDYFLRQACRYPYGSREWQMWGNGHRAAAMQDAELL